MHFDVIAIYYKERELNQSDNDISENQYLIFNKT